jgi:hypothetical protein
MAQANDREVRSPAYMPDLPDAFNAVTGMVSAKLGLSLTADDVGALPRHPVFPLKSASSTSIAELC